MDSDDEIYGMPFEEYKRMMDDFYQNLSDKCEEGIRKISEGFAEDPSKHTPEFLEREMRLISKFKEWKERLDDPMNRLTLDAAFKHAHALIEHLESEDKPVTGESLVEDAKNRIPDGEE